MSSVFPPGVQLATRYRVLRLLETNHVGALFEAEHLDSQRRVALKWLRFSAGSPAQLAQQRAARARAASLVRHPQLAVVLDVAHEGSSLFVVSELLRGEALRARLAPHAMPLHERLRALADAARAVAFAHQKGLVHGGLHPGNIFLHREHEAWVGLPPVVKVHDFGTATSTMPECLAYPAERGALGAHAFLDHAQLCGVEPDAQSDIYALAVLLFQALTGSVPFAAQSPIELAVTLATSPVPAVGDRHPGLPAPLDALIHQSLQHDRSERPRQLEPLAAQLSAYAEALAAREVFVADDGQHTRRMVQDRPAPGSLVTRMLTVMGDDAAPLRATRSEETPRAGTPATTQLATLPPPAVLQAAFAAAVQQAEFAAAIQQAKLAAYLQHGESARPLQPADFAAPSVTADVAAQSGYTGDARAPYSAQGDARAQYAEVSATQPQQAFDEPALHQVLEPTGDQLVATPTLHAPLVAPVHDEALYPPAPSVQAAGPQRAPYAGSSRPRVALEMSQSEGVVEISRHPTVVGEAPAYASRTDAQRAGYVEVVGRTRFSPQRKLVVEPSASVPSSIARSSQSARVRTWSVAAAAIVVLFGIGASLTMATYPGASALSAPPELPSVQRRRRADRPVRQDPTLVDITPERLAQQPERSAQPEQPEPVDSSLARATAARFGREAVRPVDEAPEPARRHRRDQVRARPTKVEQAHEDDGYLVGQLPTQDQF